MALTKVRDSAWRYAGSTFSITVPRVNVEETTSPTIDSRHFGKRWLEGIRILCVDDDQNILGATRALLDRWGASTACVDQPDNFHELIMGKIL